MRPKKLAFNLSFLLYIIPWTIYFSVIWSQALQVRDNGWYAAYLPHWGDGAAHLSYMAAFAFRDEFPTVHPLFSDHPFTYSFAADMLGGYLVKAGLSLPHAYNLWGFILTITTLTALWLLIKHLTTSNRITWLTTTLFLLSGGLGFKYLITDRLDQALPDTSYMPLLYTQREGTDIVWLNTIVGELIPQRAFLLAIPIACYLLITWHKRFILHHSLTKSRLITTGILLGLMPMIHPHTTLILGLTLAIWSLFELIKHPKPTTLDLLAIGLPTLIFGGLISRHILSPAVTSDFLTFLPGWLASVKNTNWIIFWLDNWGLFLPIAAFSTWRFADQNLKRTLMPFWLWFVLANLFLFQPYDWDNSKLLTWVYLFLAIPVSISLVRLWQKSRLDKVLAVIVFISMILAGGLDVAHMLKTQKHSLMLVKNEEIYLAESIKQQTSPTSVFLTSTTHRNWVPILTGRQILAGYLGWMWTYGINASQRVTDIKNIYAGSANAQDLISQHSIDYIVVGPEEEREFAVNHDFLAKTFPVFLETDSTTIYQVPEN